MAWLLAYNSGLLGRIALLDVPGAVARLLAGAATSNLGLNDKHEAWKRAAEEDLPDSPLSARKRGWFPLLNLKCSWTATTPLIAISKSPGLH